MQTISLIVSRCVVNVRKGDSDRVYGDRLVDATFRNADAAKLEGDKYRKMGLSVLVRPNYNEVDNRGRYFREWRSFNGEALREVRFRFAH